MKKRMVSILLCAAMLLMLLPMAVPAEGYTTLVFQEAVTVNTEAGESYLFQFTPTVTQDYCIYSFDEVGVDPFATLYDSTNTKITNNDDSNGSNFRIVAQLTAGETYYIDAIDYGQDDVGSFKLIVDAVTPTSMSVSESELTRFVGAEVTLTVDVEPDDAVKTVTWTSSDEAVAEVDENGKVTCLAGGEATVTAETVNGLTDSCVITVIPFDKTVTLGDMTVVITEDEETKEQMLAFTPTETGYYRFRSCDIVSTSDESIDPRVMVYNEKYEALVYNDDDGVGVNFCVDVFLEACRTYYCALALFNPETTGSYTLKVEQPDMATSVSIDGGDTVMQQGESSWVSVTYAPEGCGAEEYTVTSSDETVVAVDGHDIEAVGAGVAILTVTSERGLTDSVTVTVIAAKVLELDTTYTVEGTAEEDGGLGGYRFIPTVSGRYTIASSGVVGEDATVSVWLIKQGEIVRRNDTNSDSFSLTYELKAGVEYYYEVSVVSEAEESAVSFVLTKEDDSDIPEATVNTDLSVNITNPGDGVYYAFKPTATGTYTVFSQYDPESDLDPKLMVYDAEWVLLEDSDDVDDNRNFLLEYEFTAGVTYYLKAIMFGAGYAGEYTMRIEPLFEMETEGDVNVDGAVDMLDAYAVYRAASGAVDANDNVLAYGDMNDDGEIDMLDAYAIYRIASGGE